MSARRTYGAGASVGFGSAGAVSSCGRPRRMIGARSAGVCRAFGGSGCGFNDWAWPGATGWFNIGGSGWFSRGATELFVSASMRMLGAPARARSFMAGF